MRRAQVVVLLLSLTAGGVAAVLATRPEPPAAPPAPAPVATVEILAARTDIEVGHQLSADELQWQPWPAGTAAGYVRRSETPDAIVQVAGSTACAGFAAGEPIRQVKLMRGGNCGYMAALIRQGMRAISTDISPEAGVGGFILPGNHVDVILTRSERANGHEAYSSETILSNVRVLAIDQTVEEKNGQRVVMGKIATLELSTPQAETLALARRLGSVSLVLRSLRDSEPGHDDDGKDARLSRAESISVVRFGQTATMMTK